MNNTHALHRPGGVRLAPSLAAAVVGVAVGLLVTIVVPPAHAGTYVMRNCSVPGHPHTRMDPWSVSDNPMPPGVSVQDDCIAGGGVGFKVASGTQLPGGTSPTFRLLKPTDARRNIKFERLVLWYAARLQSSGQPLNLWAGHALPDGSFVVTLNNGPPGSEYLVAEQLLSPATQHYHVGLRCGPTEGVVSPVPCVAAHPVPLLIRGMEVTLSEDVPPTILPPTGGLLDGTLQSGTSAVTYSASDAESGLSKVEVLLGETVVASRDLTPRCAYSDFSACPTSEDESLQVDTRAVANGLHRVTLRAHDAAGNVTQVHAAGAVWVANATPPTAYELNGNLNGSKRSTLTVPYGRRVTVRGRLAQGSVPVVAGAVEVLERLDRSGAREVLRTRVKTRADGTFSTALVTRRPSRTVRLAYRPREGGQVVSRPLRLRVRAASRLSVSLRGRVLRFSGRVLSQPVPRRGKQVVMEGRAPGSAWTAFKTLRTRRSGGFAGTYRLRARRPGVLLKIRAVVPSEPGYGYVSSRSKAVAVRVR